MRALCLSLFLTVPVHAPIHAAGQEDDAREDKREQVAELVDRLGDHAKKRGKQDQEAMIKLYETIRDLGIDSIVGIDLAGDVEPLRPNLEFPPGELIVGVDVQPGPAGSGAVIINGPAARRIGTGDRITVMAFGQAEQPIEAKKVICNEHNEVVRSERGVKKVSLPPEPISF